VVKSRGAGPVSAQQRSFEGCKRARAKGFTTWRDKAQAESGYCKQRGGEKPQVSLSKVPEKDLRRSQPLLNAHQLL